MNIARIPASNVYSERIPPLTRLRSGAECPRLEQASEPIQTRQSVGPVPFNPFLGRTSGGIYYEGTQNMASNPKTTKKTETAPESSAKPTPKPGELAGLFKEYEKSDQEIRDLEKRLEAAIMKRSDTVKAIGVFGNGPYDFKGRLLTVTSRKNEEAYKAALEGGSEPTEALAKATRFFFKSTGEQTITKVA